jgi:hypothetical protein
VTVASAAGTPTGSVNVDDGTGDTCVITLSGGTGSCNLTATTSGTKTITATYPATGNFLGSSDTDAHSVGTASTTTTITNDTPDPSAVGQAYTVSFTVTSGGGTPSGNVTVADGTGATCVGTVAAGSCAITSTTAGAKNLIATYAGNANFGGSASAGTAHGVNQSATTTAITSDTPDPSTFGSAYTVNYSVSVTAPGAGTPTGNVTVADGTGGSCTATAAAGTCNISNSFPGAKSLIATYAGDANFVSSASAGTPHTVNQAATTTTITSDNPDPSGVGAAISVNVTVASTGGTPTGTVNVDDGTGDTCVITLSGGAGACNLVATTSGAKTITATYPATTNFLGSSDSDTHSVGVASTTTAITNDTPDPSTVGQAYTVSYTVTSGGGTPSGNVTVADGTV